MLLFSKHVICFNFRENTFVGRHVKTSGETHQQPNMCIRVQLVINRFKNRFQLNRIFHFTRNGGYNWTVIAMLFAVFAIKVASIVNTMDSDKMNVTKMKTLEKTSNGFPAISNMFLDCIDVESTHPSTLNNETKPA